MATNQNVNATEEQARELVEQSRESEWKGKGFLKELFLGNFRVDWIDPWPETELSPGYLDFATRLERFMETTVDSERIDTTGEYGDDVIAGFAKLGAFGMKIPKKYGGLGFTNVEYCKALEIIGRYDGNCVALISAHQSIGVPNPLKLFGTEEQKQAYLPRCAAGAISAFALTEPDVGSDPARLGTTATKNDDGTWTISGTKLWITNSTIAELLIVMARNPVDGKISAFIVEADAPGLSIEHRCRFMGLRALANGVVKFDNVKVGADAVLGGEGKGLRVALTTLNTGRLSIPAACVGGAKGLLEECRVWSTERVQWGLPVGRHEIISHKLADMAANIYGMESLAYVAAELSERKGYDIRLEASAAKEWCTVRGWTVIDEAMQIKGGRGYETETSLRERGERPAPIERAMRDSRINRIFEGSSEIMHLMMARELVDTHLKVAGVMLDKKASIGAKLAALPGIAAFYAVWYPKLWLGWLFRPSYARFGKLGAHLVFAEASSRRLARAVFHGMMLYQAKMERKQAFMFRAVDIAMELFVMVSNIVRAQKMIDEGKPEATSAVELSDLFARNTRLYVDQKFRELWAADDDGKAAVGRHLLEERFGWLEPQKLPQPAGSAGDEASAAAK
ncbi:MAG: acyl-CoA dehydrogenase family protein [Alphaproteobacteria bacterium]|nr:acyl-CoA dehydrogenase family protein [Alphaproteobacteria bacterium]